MVCHINCHVTMSVATVTCDLCAFPTTHQYQPTWQRCHIFKSCATQTVRSGRCRAESRASKRDPIQNPKSAHFGMPQARIQNPESRASNPDFQGGPPELPTLTSKPEAETLLKFFFWNFRRFLFSLLQSRFRFLFQNFRFVSPGGSHNDIPWVVQYFGIFRTTSKVVYWNFRSCFRELQKFFSQNFRGLFLNFWCYFLTISFSKSGWIRGPGGCFGSPGGGCFGGPQSTHSRSSLHQWEVMVGFPPQWPETSEEAGSNTRARVHCSKCINWAMVVEALASWAVVFRHVMLNVFSYHILVCLRWKVPDPEQLQKFSSLGVVTIFWIVMYYSIIHYTILYYYI